jgi:hypothetical protein
MYRLPASRTAVIAEHISRDRVVLATRRIIGLVTASTSLKTEREAGMRARSG